ncbi:hypothetical protein ACIBCN_20885 [Nocardia sp. NPDC051052]|uniref:hypothetical protein n=1 Tax=Nocardia sp. NPDC051052 TaxID=3364322 RepID=UPI0037A14F2B
MMKDVAVQSNGGVALARIADSVVAEWKRGLRWLESTRAHPDEPVAKARAVPQSANELLLRVDPMIAVRWRGSL